jgi:hypothetical protein
MMARSSILVFLVVVVLGLSACVVSEELGTNTPPVSPLRTERQETVAETPLSSSPLPTPIAPEITPTLEAPGAVKEDPGSSKDMSDGERQAVAAAKQALADLVKVTLDEIELVSVKSVQFRNSSLGCPQKGMVYLQVITPGYQVLLSLEGQTYDYRISGQKAILCQGGQ